MTPRLFRGFLFALHPAAVPCDFLEPLSIVLATILPVHASRHDPGFRAFRARMQANGLTVKQALVATARKLLTVLSAMIRSDTDFARTAAA